MTVHRWIFVALAAVLVLGGCAGKSDREVAFERANSYVAANPGLKPEIATAIRELKLVKGMTQEQVTAAWGRPALVRQSGIRTSNTETWYFGCDFPHLCAGGGGRRGQRSEEAIYQSRAVFISGILSEWRT